VAGGHTGGAQVFVDVVVEGCLLLGGSRLREAAVARAIVGMTSRSP
jgi:hypothetical protein